MSEMHALTGLDNPNSPVQVKTWLKEHGIETDTIGKDAVASMLKADLTDDVRHVLELRLQSSKTSAKKYQAMKTAVCEDGRLHGMFRFYGASRTGRFSGSIVQLQNLKRNSMPDLDTARELVKQRNYAILTALYDDVPDVLGQLVRTALVPPPGKLFAVADYSAIEARVLAWLSGEKWVLDAFRNNEDLYCATASRMYHCTVEKHGRNSELRQRGKQAILACGYSGGIGAIKAFAGDEISDEDAQSIVDSWRQANPHTVSFWYALNNAAKDAVIQHVTTSVRVGHGQRIKFRKVRNWLLVDLPSGRHLSYYRPKIGLNKFGTETVNYVDPKTNIRIDVYGGVFAENVTQVLARDLLCNAIHLLAERGYHTVAHIHDEVVVEVSDEMSLHDVEKLMATNPEWAKGLPLAAAGYVCTSYRKD